MLADVFQSRLQILHELKLMRKAEFRVVHSGVRRIAEQEVCLGSLFAQQARETGGAVLASGAVAQGIEQAGPAEGGGVLMHGPTFMGNPLFCAAACQSIDLLLASPWQERVRNIEGWLREGLEPCRRHPAVADVRVLGAIGVVEAKRPVDMARLQDYFVSRGVWIRPFNRNVYLMPPFVSPEEDVALLCDAIRGAFDAGLC